MHETKHYPVSSGCFEEGAKCLCSEPTLVFNRFTLAAPCVDSSTLICLCVCGLFLCFCFLALQDPAGEGRAGGRPDSGRGGNKDHFWKYPRHLWRSQKDQGIFSCSYSKMHACRTTAFIYFCLFHINKNMWNKWEMCLLKGTVQIGQYFTIVLRGQPSQTAHTKYCCKSAQRPATAQLFLIKLG